MTAPTTAPRRGRSGPVPALVAALALALGAAGCSDDPAAPGDRAGGEQGGAARLQAAAGTVETETTVGRVTGRLPGERRRPLKRSVSRVLDAWVDRAYVGGDFPRDDFEHAWPGFSSGAKDEARRDRSLTSNAAIGRRVDDLTVRKRRVVLDVLASRGHAVGVTAHVVVVFDTTGRVEGRHRVSGDLYLSRREGAWQVFGYDISRGLSRDTTSSATTAEDS